MYERRIPPPGSRKTYKNHEKLFPDAHFEVWVDEVSAPDKQVINHIHCTVNNNKFMNKARFAIAA